MGRDDHPEKGKLKDNEQMFFDDWTAMFPQILAGGEVIEGSLTEVAGKFLR